MKKSLLLFISGTFLVLLFLGVSFWWKTNVLPVDPSDKQKINFVIRRGEGIDEISTDLESKHLIKSQFHFKILVTFLGINKKIQAGSYLLSPSLSEKEIANLITRGNNDQWVTVIEGLRQEQIREQLLTDGFPLDSSLWEKQISEGKLEGKLFPDSYLFPKGATEGAVLKIINRNFQKKVVNGLQKELAKSNLSLDQVLTMASIVERESKDNPDRLIVAGILLKRLNNDWPLQADATVQYAIASTKCKAQSFGFAQDKSTKCEWWPQRLASVDLKIKSPYNTYLNKGLSLGPICNPGLSAIKAVLSPKESNYWFYLTGNDGKMHYAATSEEHAENIRLYLQ